MTSTQQQLVGGIGGTMVVLNFWQNQRPTIMAGSFSSSASPAQSAAAHVMLRNIALELLFVGVATLMAGSSSKAASAAMAVMVSLAIVFAVNYTKRAPAPAHRAAGH